MIIEASEPRDKESATGRGARFGPVDGLAALGVVVMPLVAAVIAIRTRWYPIGDWATVTVRSYEVFSRHPPLIGMPSTVSTYTGSPVHHPGPLQFWILAIPVRLFGEPGYGAVVGSALLSSVALAVFMGVAWRRAGRSGIFVAGILLAAMMAGLYLSPFRDPMNPFSALLPFAAFLVLCWSVLDRERWAWPFLVFFGSYAAMAHLTFTIGVAIVACATTAAWVVLHLRERRSGRAESARRRWALPATTLVVGLLCWSGPLYDQFFGSGNLGLLIRGSDSIEARRGLRAGVSALVDQLSMPPVWLHPMKSPRGVEDLFMAFVFVVCAMFVVVWGWRRRDRSMLTLATIAAAAAVSGVVVESLLPAAGSSADTPNLTWFPIGVTLWFTVSLGLARALLAARWAAPIRRPQPRVGAALCSAAMIVGLTVWAAPKASARFDLSSAQYGELATYSSALDNVTWDGTGILVVPCSIYGDAVFKGLVAEMLFKGMPVHVDDSVLPTLGQPLKSTGRERVRISLCRAATPPGEDYRLITSYDPDHPPARWRDYVGFFHSAEPMGLWLRDSRGS